MPEEFLDTGPAAAGPDTDPVQARASGTALASDPSSQAPATTGRERALVILSWFGFLTLLTATAVAASARRHWLAELVCNLRFYIGLAGVPVMTGFFMTRRRVLGVLAAGVLGFHLYPALLLHLPEWDRAEAGEVGAADAEITLEVGVANLLYENEDATRMLAWVQKERPDVLALLEVTAYWAGELVALEELYPYSANFDHPEAELRENAFGMRLLSRRPLLGVEVRHPSPSGPPFLEALVKCGEECTLQVVVLHPMRPLGAWSVAARNEYLSAVGAEVEWATRAVVLADLNATLYSPAYADLLAATGLRDTRRGFGYLPTWSPPGLPGFWLDLDHVFVRGPIDVEDRWLGPEIGSDHLPALARIGLRR